MCLEILTNIKVQLAIYERLETHIMEHYRHVDFDIHVENGKRSNYNFSLKCLI